MRISLLLARFLAVLTCVGSLGALPAADAVRAPEPPAVRKKRILDFQLLPKSFSSHPQIDMTVFSERTEYGRTLPDVTPENPAYYLAQSQGFQDKGSSPSGVTPPTQENIDPLLRDMLAKRGFLPADESHPPTLGLFYFWGAHAAISLSEAVENPDLMPVRERDLLQRAKLVGGRAYAEKVLQQLHSGLSPVDRTPRDDHLRYQIQHDIYYLVVSAYEYASLTQGERRLIWRTTMTVNEEGVSLKETLPPLIASATDYIGRDTGDSVALERRITRGSVTLGPLTIIGEAPPPAPAPAPAPAPSKD